MMFQRLRHGLSRLLVEKNQNQKSFQSSSSQNENQNSSPSNQFVGFRVFNAGLVPDKLTGPMYHDFVWEQRVISEALCSSTKHRPAESGCGCGFWALWDIENSLNWRPVYPTVLGAILGWGRVQRHSDEGFRCQYAQIIGFLEPQDNVTITDSLTYIINHNKQKVQRLSELYDVPMLPKNELAKFALAQGLTYSQLKGELK